MSAIELTMCWGREIEFCPANQAVYGTDIKSRAQSLYLQSKQARDECGRTVSTRTTPPDGRNPDRCFSNASAVTNGKTST